MPSALYSECVSSASKNPWDQICHDYSRVASLDVPCSSGYYVGVDQVRFWVGMIRFEPDQDHETERGTRHGNDFGLRMRSRQISPLFVGIIQTGFSWRYQGFS